MVRLVRFKLLGPWRTVTIMSIFALYSIFIFYSKSCMIVDEYRTFYHTKETRYERFCNEVNQRAKLDKLSTSPIDIDPLKGSIPYSYSQWRSSPLLPRVLTPCEHALYMKLLSILTKDVFTKYNIPYMMTAATLLGSYTRHDILPWDDDIDLFVSIEDRARLQSIIVKELSSEPHSIIIMQLHNHRNYDKVFFAWCPHAGKGSWRFPFIDIFYYSRNSSHIQLLGTPSSCPTLLSDVFPLVLRPLGAVWLYSPREPMAHFESRRMTHIETGCYAFPYSHKYEKSIRNHSLIADCNKLQSIYPYVKRTCRSYTCVENLKLGNDTIIQTLTYKFAYRTFILSEKKKYFKPC